MRFTARALLGASLVLLLPACEGCRKPATEHPARYVSKDAEAILEVRSLDLGVRLRSALPLALGALIPAEQVEAGAKELELLLGFDPTSAAGLAAAGLPESGPVAAQIAAGGASALWIFPVKDEARLRPLLEKLIRVRVTVDEVTTAKVGEVTVTRFLSAFGDEKTLVAAHAFAHGLAFVGAGREGEALIGAALALKPEDSVLRAPEYVAQTQALGEGWDVRFVSPSGGKALGAALRTAARRLGQPAPAAVEGLDTVASAGWAVRFTLKAAELVGRVRLDPAGLERSRRLFGAGGPAAVGLADLPDAVLYAEGALDPAAALELLAPAGSPARAGLESASARARADIGTDLEKELVPLLAGQGALAVGLGDLAGQAAMDLLQDPRRGLWTAFAVGVKDPAAAVALEKRLDAGLAARGLAVVERKAKDVAVRMMGPAPASGQLLVETFAVPGAWAFSNAGAVTDAMLDGRARKGRLDGKPGVVVELRFRTLAERLARLDLGSVPLLARGLVTKAMEALRGFDTASLRVSPAPDGVAIEGRVALVGPAAGGASP